MMFQSTIANYAWIFLIGLSPITEARGAIIWGLAANLPGLNVFFTAYIANIIAIPILMLFLKKTKLMDFLRAKLGGKIERKIERNKKRFEAYEELALLAFVTLPAPGSGIYTACIISEFLKLNQKKTFLVVSLGAFFAALIVYFTTNGVLTLVKWF